MKPPLIEIRVGDLRPAIVGLGKVIPARGNPSAQDCVKIESLNRKTIQLTATDLDVTLRIEVPTGDHQKIEPFLVPLGQLRESVKGCKAADCVQLASPSKALALSEFPETTTFRATPIHLPDEVPTSLLRAFSSASQDPTRYLLRGAYLDTTGKGQKAHRIVGTDGRHLFSSNSLHFPAIKEPVILPDHKLWQWKPIAGSRPWTLRIGTAKTGGSPFRIDGPFWSVSGRCLEGNYPNYRQVIPPASDFKSVMDMPEEVVKAISGLIPKLPGKQLDNQPLGIRAEKGFISLLARDSFDEPWQLYPIGKASCKGSDFTVFAKREYVEKALRFGLHQLKVSDESSPLQYCRKGDLMIVMPLRITDAKKVAGAKNVTPLVSDRKKEKAPSRQVEPASKPDRKPRKPARRSPSKSKPTAVDPLNEAEARIADANQALRSVGKELKSATGSLKKVRKQRSADQDELGGFRSLLRSINRFGRSNHN